MWKSRTKLDLVIEVWERLDCETVGAAEIEAIETVVEDRFGRSAVDSPMITARMLADEGAVLRHAEIMRLYVERNLARPYEAEFRNLLRLSDLRSALGTLRAVEGLRRKFGSENDKDGLRLLRKRVLEGKAGIKERANSPRTDDVERQINIEISEWISVWLQTPELFDAWVDLRQRSKDFVERFGKISS